VLDQFPIQPDIIIRHAQQTDLRKLEWFGLLTPVRDHIENAYARAQQGNIIFLVADLNGFPIGQVWVEIHESAGLIQALRVLKPLQNMGIGTRLIYAVERALVERELHTAEIHVELNNPDAKRLYERLGYSVIGDKILRWSYTRPDGEPQQVEDHVWVLRKMLENR
jgi:ribosomal protein S18 acetylase RimI-like enzyme